MDRDVLHTSRQIRPAFVGCRDVLKAIRTVVRAPLAISLLLSLLVCLSLLGLRWTGNLESLELAAYDWTIRLRPVAVGADARVALMTITESDIHHYGWPLPDAILAQLLETLLAYQPRAIGLDIYRDIPVPPGSEALEAVLTSDPRIIAIMQFGHTAETRVAPPPVLASTEQVGFNDVVVDAGGTVRRGLLFVDDGETVFMSFALRLALRYLQAEGIVPQPDAVNPQHLRLGRTTIRPFVPHDGSYVDADAGGYQLLLDWRTGQGTFPVFPMTALFDGEVPGEALRDKVVLVGMTAVSVKDMFYTPYNQGMHTQPPLAGVALHAHIVSQLLRHGLDGDPTVRTMREGQEVLWILLWCLLGGIVGLLMHSLRRFLLAIAGGLLVLGLTAYVTCIWGWWIPVVPPVLAWLSTAALVTAYMSNQEKVQRALLMRLFAQSVSPEVAAAIWQQREHLLDSGRLRPQRMIASVLFTDLMGFTSVSEKLPPQTLLDWLNAYMDTMVQHVLAYGGVINKYMGDSILAIFGVPLPRTSEAEIGQDAVHAVECALAMEQTLRQLNHHWHEQNLPTIGMRVGIYTGPLLAGSLGSVQRWEYTVLGDTVNTASRLESFDKDFLPPDPLNTPCRILIGESTRQYLGQQFQTRRVGKVRLKGKDEHITMYQVIGRIDCSPETTIHKENP